MNTHIKKIALALAVLIFLIICYFIGMRFNLHKQEKEKINQQQQEDSLSPQTDLVGRVSSDIINAVITRQNDTIELVKKDEGEDIVWYLKGYENTSFNQENIGMLAKSLSTLYSGEKIKDISAETANIDELKDYGLDNPSTTAVINFNDGNQTTIYVGNPTSDKLYRYAMVKGGDGIYLIDEINNQRYNYTLNDLVDKSIPSIKPVQILYVDIKQKNKDEIEIEYQDTTQGNAAEMASYGMQTLTMKKPLAEAAVYPNNLQSTILKNLSSFEIESVVETEPKSLSPYGLDDPYMEIKLKDNENELKLKLGNLTDSEQSYYCMAQDRNVVYTISKELIDPFENANIIDFIERFVALVYRKDAKEVDLKGFGNEYKITFKDNPEEKSQEEDDNRIGVLNGKELDGDSFSNLYQAIIGITFDSLSNTQQIEGEPSVSIKFELMDSSVKEINYYEYNANNNFYIVQIDGDTSRLVNKQSLKTVFDLAQKLSEK